MSRPRVNVIADRIKAHMDAGHSAAMIGILHSHSWITLADFTASAGEVSCAEVEQALDAWEGNHFTPQLHEEPKKDGFTHETPIRAFTTWSTEGIYALGKGFRPSLQHLIPYLDAMERKEGWRLVQVLEAGTQTPSFIFRYESPAIYTVKTGLDTDVSPEFKAQIEAFLANTPNVGGVTIPHDQRYVVRGKCDWQMVNEFLKEQGFSLRCEEDEPLPNPIMPEVFEKLDSAQEMADLLSRNEQRDYGDETTYETLDLVEHGTGKVLKQVAVSITPERITRPGPVASIPFELPSHAMSDRTKALLDDTEGLAPDNVTVPGPPSASITMTDIRPANFAKAFTGDDPINPKHYGGTACADIGELLTANSYQVLKYNWRLGEKDEERIELGKALWYLDREIELGALDWIPNSGLPEDSWFDERLIHATTPHAYNVGRILIAWNRHGHADTLKGLRGLLQTKLDKLDRRVTPDMGRGQEP